MSNLDGNTLEGTIDVEDFLEKNNLHTQEIINTFKSLRIKIEELFDLNDDQLKLNYIFHIL